jgi:hypothetical protein
MYIHLKDSTIKLSEIVAVTKNVIPATNFTPQYFAMAVYVKGIEPIIHTYELEKERDEVFAEVRETLDEYREESNSSTN